MPLLSESNFAFGHLARKNLSAKIATLRLENQLLNNSGKHRIY